MLAVLQLECGRLHQEKLKREYDALNTPLGVPPRPLQQRESYRIELMRDTASKAAYALGAACLSIYELLALQATEGRDIAPITSGHYAAAATARAALGVLLNELGNVAVATDPSSTLAGIAEAGKGAGGPA